MSSRSPFPGMDPYLEASWSDVHVKMVAFVAEALTPLLPPGLRARSEELVSVEAAPGESDLDEGFYRPDVVVTRSARTVPTVTAGGGSALAVPEPVRVHLERVAPTEKRVIIVDARSGNRLITALEILSPANKAAGLANRTYRRKLEDYRRGEVSVVEIDLLRWPGRERLEVDQSHLPASARTPYLISVRRGWEADDWDVYPVSLRERVPAVPVPLRQSDAELVLDLQPIIERVYAAGGYGDDIDYRKPCDPPLEGQDAAWAEELLKNAGKR